MLSFDLNLVRTFCVLYEERGVTRTAEKLHLTQPTVSYALKNLRRQYRDELFVRSGRRLEPTQVAHQLYPGLKAGVEQILMASTRSVPFEPAEARNRFTLWMSDLGELALLPRIMEELNKVAPHVQLVVQQLNVPSVIDALVRGEIDGAILSPVLESSAVERTVVYNDEYVVIGAANHPRIGSTLSLEEFTSETHVKMASGIGHEVPELAADNAGLQREFILEISRFAGLPQIIAVTDSLAVVPRFVASHVAKSVELKVLPHPLHLPPVQVSLYHLPRSRQSEAQRWISALIKDVLQSL